MSPIQYVKDFLAPLLTWPKDKSAWAAFFFALMQVGAVIYVLLFPLGRVFRELGSLVAFFSMIIYLCLDYPSSQLKNYQLKWVFALFCAILVFKTIHSMDPIKSLGGLERCTYHGLMLFFVGLEIMRSRRSIVLFVSLFTVMTLYEGFDGLFQFITKKDFFFGMTMDGTRLTASFSTPRVGNLMALALPILLCLPALLPSRWSKGQRFVLTGLLMTPGIFLLIGSLTRTGYIGFAVACLVFLFYHLGVKKSLMFTVVVALFIGVFMLKTHSRLSWTAFENDPRWEIWNDNFQTFKAYPLLGSGIYTSREAKRSLGITGGEYSDISHPHNSYIQFLAETGIIGFFIFIGFLGSHAFYLLRQLISPPNEHSSLELPLLAFFGSYLAYCAASISAHNFYEGWWLGLPMLILGMAIGIAQMTTRNDQTIVA